MNSQHPAAAPAPRRNWVRRLANLLVALVVIAVAAATFAFSYDGVHAIALLGGMSARLARYYPGLFDAVLVIACVAAVVLRDARWWARAWAWVVLVVVLAAIGATDVVHAMNYTLRPRTTEGIVAAAPVVAVLLAFSLLLTLLRQSRSQGAGDAAGDAPGDWAARRPAMPAPLELPALPAAPIAADASALTTRATMADAATVETQAMPAGPAIRLPAPPIALPAGQETGPVTPPDVPPDMPPAPPIALPAGQETGPMTPPDGLPAMTRPATEPDRTLPPAAPPTASQRVLEGAPASPTVSSPALARPAPSEPSEPSEPAAARPQGIRYAGSGAQARPAGPPAAEPAAAEPAAAEPAAAGPPAEPGTTPAALDGPHEDYWDGDDAAQFAGLVYPVREASARPGAAAGHDSGDSAGPAGDVDDHTAPDDGDTEAGGPAPGREPGEVDEDAPPFATAPFATVPRLNRVRSMPVPPEDDDEPQ